MDPTAVDPSGIEVPIFDEDPDENFSGPVGIGNFFNDESEVAELFNGDYEDDDEYYDGDGSYQPEPLETSVSQRVAQEEATHAETVSGHTQKSSNSSLGVRRGREPKEL